VEELPIWLKECVEPSALAGIGLGRLANFPSVIDGSKMASRPMGEALTVPTFSGVEIFECVQNTVNICPAGANTAIPGNAALTVPDITAVTYATNGAASGTIIAPVNGVGYPAFITSDAENWNLAATDGILSVRINGQLFTANVGVGAATTAEAAIAAILAAGWPCMVVGVINAGAIDRIRISALGNFGVSTTMQAIVTAGTAGAVIFAAETGALRFGAGGVLNDMRSALAVNGAQLAGIKVGHRILPGSITLSATLAGAIADSMTDNRAGVLSNLLGTSVGTIVYATGVVRATWQANASGSAVNASFQALWPVDMYKPVRVNEHNGGEFAIRLL
jgi:hypothetical protein